MYKDDLKKASKPIRKSFKTVIKSLKTLDPWKQFMPTFWLVATLHLFIIRFLFYSIKKIAGGY